MIRWLRAWLGRDRTPPSQAELAERERIRREAEQERLRGEVRRAEERAPLDSHGRGGFGGW
jgi:hypothetical protein